MSNPPVEADKSGVAIYCGLLKDELAAQDIRKGSFEQRGLAVVTTAGALATLLFGLAAFSATGTTRPLPRDTKELLVVALVFFVIAGTLALLTNLPVGYQVVAPSGPLNKALKDPSDGEVEALRWTARVYAGTLTDAKRKNKCKGELLFAALAAEIVAIGFVALAVAHAI